MITKDNVTWAVKTFDPYKSAGHDVVVPAKLQNSLFSTAEILLVIFRARLTLGHIHEVWKKLRVAFVNKACKSSRYSPTGEYIGEIYT